MSEKIYCKACNESESFVLSFRANNLGAYCENCGEKAQGWVKYTDTNTAEASEKQQRYALSLMTKWKHSGKNMTAAQAGGIINLFGGDKK